MYLQYLCVCCYFSNEDDLIREEYHSLEVGSKEASSSYKGVAKGKATSEKPRIVSLPNREGKRKRGRPSGMSTKKGKSVVNQSRRTRPLRVGNKAAKIYENESEKSASSDDKEVFEASGIINCGNYEMLKNKVKSCLNQPRRTGASSEDQTMKKVSEASGANHGPSESANLFIPDFGKKEEVKDSTPQSSKAVELGDSVDPVQAMLLNMIPILGTKKVESAVPVPVPEEVKARGPFPISIHEEEEKLPLDAEMQPVKKRKVSYKDVASELLKDW